MIDKNVRARLARSIRAVAVVLLLGARATGDADREHFVAIYLDNQDRFLGLNVVAIGTINLLHVTACEVFKPAILCNAVRLIVLSALIVARLSGS